ncbi:E3 ubiquitin-protein ligase TRIM39-like [Brachyistius frenatus]|uniref:E3 ubiquitin-protein ligase TRIM39-like n=1 Tax=Brachyistius frenatus TaxID=100188 RepID=UPI0037E8CF84
MSPTIRPVYSGATRAVLCVFLLSGLRYHLINQSKNWHEARKHCREHFLDLATVDNMEDMERLITAAGSGFSGQKHTDLTSVRSEEESAAIQGVVPHDKLVAIGLRRPTWIWWSDNTRHNFKYWQDGRPTARSGNCAASVINATSHGKWIENHCNIELPFMCYDNSKQAFRIKLTALESTIDLNDPAVTAAILNLTERAIQSGSQVCSMLIGAVKRQQAGLVVELEERQREAERRAEELLDELERETEDLQTRSSELQHLEITQSPLHLLQSFPSLSSLPSTRDWPEVAVHSDNCVGAVRRVVAKLVDVCQEAVHKLSAEEADKMNQYAVDVTLDPETASGWLVLSPDRKKVSLTCQKTKAPLPDNPERFDSCICALGKQSFSSGRRYWVVQVGNKTDWVVGVARESIDRKGAITLRPGSGYWAICRRKGGSVSACAGPSVALLLLPETPQKVGIFLDYEKGSVSFYDAEAKTHIYTYSGCAFSEPLYPYFNPCVQHDGKNAAPLVICPLERSARDERDVAIESDV